MYPVTITQINFDKRMYALNPCIDCDLICLVDICYCKRSIASIITVYQTIIIKKINFLLLICRHYKNRKLIFEINFFFKDV